MAFKSKIRLGQLNQAIDADVSFSGDGSRKFIQMDKDGNVILGDGTAGVQLDGAISGSSLETNVANNTANKVPSASAVKTYVDAHIIDEDNMASNSASLPPSQQSVKAFVEASITAQDLDLAGDGGTGAVDLDSQSLTIAGGTGLTSAAAAQTVTLSLDDTAVTPASYGAQSTIPTFTVDQQGRLTGAGTANVLLNRLDQFANPTADINMNSRKITNVASPTNANDAVNKSFVDNLLSGLDTKASVKAASTANEVLTYSHNGGTGNVGTLTKGSTGAISIDGVALQEFDRVLLKNQSAARQNGIWEVTTAGAAQAGARLSIRVMGNYSNINANSTLVFDVDSDGAGGAQTFTITFTKPGSGSSDTQFSAGRAASIRIDEGANAQTLAGTIRTLFTNAPFASTSDWDAPAAVAADSGGFSFSIEATNKTNANFDFANVTADVDSAGELFGSKVDRSAAAALVLTRAPDADGTDGVGAKLSGGSFVFVEQGTANADAGFVVTSDFTVPFQPNQDSDGPTWTQFTGAGSITKGNGIGGTGNNIEVNVDDSTIEIDSDTLRLKDNGVSLAKLASFGGRGRLITSDGSNDPIELAAGSADQILRVDGSGDLGYQDLTGLLRPKVKYFTTNNLQIGGGSNNTTTQINQVGGSADLQAGSGPAYNNVMNSDGISAVFLNGMRLIGSGSDSTAIGSNFDYRFVAQGGKVRIEFAADLIAVGDVVQVVLLS